MKFLNTDNNDEEVRFAMVNTLRVGRKNITKISELHIEQKDVYSVLKKQLGSNSVETIRGTYCSLIVAEPQRDEAEHVHTFVLEGSESEKEYISGSFIIAGHVKPSGTFDDLDTRIDEEWIDNRLLLTVFKGQKKG